MNSSINHTKELELTFGQLFSDYKEESEIDKARTILGDIAKDMSDTELASYLTMFKYLIEGWMDQYEREIFDGLTLQELLQERRS